MQETISDNARFFDDISELQQATNRLEETRADESHTLLPDDTWHEELDVAAAIASALETGANEVSAPKSRLTTNRTDEEKREEE